jgi:hypothetical protein
MLVFISLFVCQVYTLYGIADSAPRGGGGGRGGSGGRSNTSSSKNNTGSKNAKGYYLHGGLYPVSRSKDVPAPVKAPPVSRSGLGAWGIIGIVLGVLALCSGLYYTLYLCDLSQRTAINYRSNLAAQHPHLMTDKPKPEENGNGNIPMTDKNELARGSMKNGLNEVFL